MTRWGGRGPILGAALGLLLLSVPVLHAAGTGSITGLVDHPDQVHAVAAIDRETGKRYVGTLAGGTGQFTIDQLPLEAEYDCQVDFAGARLEGVSLSVPPSDYEIEQPLSAGDIETIKEKVRTLNQFENVVEILAVTGNVAHAAILLNKLKTDGFVNAGPNEIIWRAELWHFERPEETWAKVQNELWTVLYRERLPREAFAKKSVTFDSRLGGLRVTAKQPKLDVGRITLPPATPGIRLRSSASR